MSSKHFPVAARLLLASGLVLALLPAGAAERRAPSPWADVPSILIPPSPLDLRSAPNARTLSLDVEALKASLRGAPAPGSRALSTTVLSVPMPDGGTLDFRVQETDVMPAALAARFPQIRTYAGTAIGEPGTTGRFDIGPRGFHGMVSSARGTAYIDPVRRGETRYYRSYFRRDLLDRRLPPDQVIPRSTRAAAARTSGLAAAALSAGVSRAGELRTYRLALAADGEYSQFQDPPANALAQPDKGVVLAELVNVTNRVTGIYERELGIRLQLVENEDQIIFTSPLLDPYVDSQGTQMLLVNTAVIDARIGSANYDIGHVVSTGGGGVAGLGVVCVTAAKGRGVTGLPEPIGDGFYVDYVAHEMGHQFGANHTFNSETGSCGGGNRNASTAYEPGSGTTIMAYAGICGADNTAQHSDDFFHAASFDEIVAYTTTDTGNSCGTLTQTGNQPPVVTVPAGGFTIPVGTPFELTGAATDPDGDALSYYWEQFDLGAAGSPDSPDATAPLFRDFRAVPSPTRVFPQPSDLFTGTHTLGEILPAVTRTLNFRLTARDNRIAPSSGGVASAALSFEVTAAAGPFRVTAPLSNATLRGGDALAVGWDVAGTTAAPVSCAAVDIAATSDLGQHWTPLLTGVPNNGSAQVRLPNVAASALRLRVKCSNNVFFALAPATLTIEPVAGTTTGGSTGGTTGGSTGTTTGGTTGSTTGGTTGSTTGGTTTGSTTGGTTTGGTTGATSGGSTGGTTGTTTGSSTGSTSGGTTSGGATTGGSGGSTSGGTGGSTGTTTGATTGSTTGSTTGTGTGGTTGSAQGASAGGTTGSASGGTAGTAGGRDGSPRGGALTLPALLGLTLMAALRRRRMRRR